jgi:hypothetical protein
MNKLAKKNNLILKKFNKKYLKNQKKMDLQVNFWKLKHLFILLNSIINIKIEFFYFFFLLFIYF